MNIKKMLLPITVSLAVFALASTTNSFASPETDGDPCGGDELVPEFNSAVKNLGATSKQGNSAKVALDTRTKELSGSANPAASYSAMQHILKKIR